jgi:hypothetical protein
MIVKVLYNPYYRSGVVQGAPKQANRFSKMLIGKQVSMILA